MFSRRLNVLLCAFLLAGGVLVARLGQIQLGRRYLFDMEEYERAGGSHLVETVRGGIYTRWGTPLAVQVHSFDLAVRYSQLLLACSKPWERTDVRELMDEYVDAVSPGVGPNKQSLAAAAEERYARLWSSPGARSPVYGSMEDYVRRRLSGESKKQIERGPAPPRAADWRDVVGQLTGVPAEELTGEADEAIRRVEHMEGRVRAAQMAREGRADIRVAERYQYHCVVQGVAPEVAAVCRTEPGRFPAVRVRRESVPAVVVLERSRRLYPNGSLAPHVVGQMVKLSPKLWDEKVEQGRAWWMGMPFADIGRRYTMDERAGASGMEMAREDLLRGTRGYVLNRLAFGVLKVEKVSLESSPEPGGDVYLTVREDFQRAASAALARAAATAELEAPCWPPPPTRVSTSPRIT